MFGRTVTPALSEREERLLDAVIERHLLTAEPVSSSQIAEQGQLAVSSATIRNLMGRLESLGFLSHPYTSAGKVPTAGAYRHFVERVLDSGRILNPEWAALRTELIRRVREVDQIVHLAAGVLAAVTQLLAVGWVEEGLTPGRLARVELIRLAPRRLLVVTLTTAGDEFHQTLEMNIRVGTEVLRRVAAMINEHGRGRTAEELDRLASRAWPGTDRRVLELFRQALLHAGFQLQQGDRAGVAMEGTGNLISQPEFRDVAAVRGLVEFLERRQDVVRAFSSPGLEHGALRAVVGEMLASRPTPALSLLTIALPLDARRTARLGVVGPMRMAYARVLSVLHETAETLTEALGPRS